MCHLRLAVLAAVVLSGCSSENSVDCSCAPAKVQVIASKAVDKVVVTGTGCDTTEPTPTKQSNTTIYAIAVVAEGECSVEVRFTDGTKASKSFPVKYEASECCAGNHVQGESTWTVP